MKVFEKIILIIYSIIVLILSAVLCLLIFNWINLDVIINVINNVCTNRVSTIITLIISIFFILISLKCIFFGTKKSDIYKDNILLKNEEGKLIITKTSLENLANNSIKGFESVQEYNTKVKLDKENNIAINVSLLVRENASLKELTENIQTKIKHVIKKTSDLEVKEINVKIKNIEATENIIKE